MSTNGNRADKLYQGLTAHERGIVRLHCFKEDMPDPAALEASTPWEQVAEVNVLTKLMNGAHHEASWYGLWLQARLEAVSVRLGMLSLLHLWALDSEDIRDRLGLPKPSRRSARRSRTPVWPPSAGLEGSLGRDLVRKVEEGITAAWAELLAVEAVVAETAGAFDGEEPIHPLARGLLDDVKARALELAEGLEVLRDGYALPEEPDVAVLELLRDLVRGDGGRS